MGNHILQEAARTYNMPCHTSDLDVFISRIRRMEQTLGKQANIYCATKASPFLTVAAAQAIDDLGVRSPGEYTIYRRVRVPAQKTVLSGVDKEESHIRSVMAEQGTGAYTAKSLNQSRLLEACAGAAGRTGVRVLLRLTSGNQSGMDEGDILTLIRNRSSYPHLDLIGFQCYSGAQKEGMEKIEKELIELDSSMDFVREHLDFEFRELEYGLDFQIPYFEGQEQADEEILLQEFKKVLGSLNSKGIVFLETGRFLVAPYGSYLTCVADAKRNQGQNYCIVGGGINHISYYGQTMAMKVPAYRYIPQDNPARPPASQTSDDRWTVCDSLCTSGDILVKNLPLDGLMIGDLLVFDRIGTCSVTGGIYLFLSRKLLVVLTYIQEHGLFLVRDALPTDILNNGSTTEIYQSQSSS